MSLHRFQLPLALLFTVVFVSCSSQPDEVSSYQKQDFQGTYDVHFYRLKNGLKVFLIEDDRSPTLAYQTWFDVGSRHEERGKTGLAHLFEHMMFKRTKTTRDGDFMKILEARGSQGINAFTSQDYTAYVQSIPSKHLEKLIQLESDRMTQLVVDKKAFFTELQVVQNERRQRQENSPSGKMFQTLYKLAFEGTPYDWPVIGYEEDLAGMSPADANAFYRHHYNPSNANIIVVGDIDHKKTIRTISQHYGKIEKIARPKTKEQKTTPSQKKTIRRKMRLNVQTDQLMMAFDIGQPNETQSAALTLLPYLISQGRSTRLNQKLVEQQKTSYISSGFLQHHLGSMYLFYTSMIVGHKASTAINIINSELKEIAKDGFSPKEIERAINQYTFDYYSKLASFSGVASMIGQNEIVLGNYLDALKIQKRALSIRSEELKQVVKNLFFKRKLTIVTGVKK